jgi:hypothetical protein
MQDLIAHKARCIKIKIELIEMLKRIIASSFLLFVFINGHTQIKWPAITQTTKPWTRWWWEGSAVDKKNLTWNLEQYKNAGLGGMEITPIYGVHGYEKQFINFLSPQWMQMFDYTLAEARRLGLGIDLANATGWPFGGPWVSNEHASKTVYHKTYTLNAGEVLKENIVYEQQALVRTANNKQVSVDSLLQPVSANKNLQSLALDQIIFPGKLPLQLVMAYPENGDAIDLTNKVDVNGRLNWTAPLTGGKWTLYALFVGLHGKMVERAAPGGEGYAIDHFSSRAVKNYFKKFDEAFKGHDISYLRAFFNDSYEVDDARGQANWTPDFFSDFKKKKGYDLKKYLPALFQKDSQEINSRVIYDYRSTIDELLLEHFTEAWKKWGSSKDALVRNQSHGSPANTLDLYAAVDIPETEGNDILRFKFATSAAHVTGKRLISSESVTWLNEHFLSSLADVKKAVDLYFLGGVNHIFYHGTAYSPKEAPWPGWLFYAAVHFQPTNPQWKDFHVLNEYVTRVQSFLQNGKPDNDILLYYPIVDRYSEPGTELLQHFDGMERNFENTDFEYLSKWMLNNGYSFDFFSDRQLKNFIISKNKIVTGGKLYQTILLPANKLISEKSLEKLFSLAKNGATILIYKNLPSDVPGLSQLENRRKTFLQLTAQFYFADAGKIKKASVGNGAFLIGDNINTLLETAKVRKETASDNGLSFERRKNNDGDIYFINNRSDRIINDWVTLNTIAISVALFDPMYAKSGLAKWKKNGQEKIDVLLQLQPFESVIVQTYQSKKIGGDYQYIQATAQPQEIKGEWTIEFLNGGPVLPQKIITSKLGSWTELDGEDVKNFSGTAKYSVSFEKPAGNTSSWIFDLGKVNETAEVILNGKKITTLVGPTFQCVIPSSAFQQSNKLEIIVANLMANRIAYMDRNNIPWKIFYNTNMPARRRENAKNGLFDASSWKPLPSGLIGPVTLTPIRYE